MPPQPTPGQPPHIDWGAILQPIIQAAGPALQQAVQAALQAALPAIMATFQQKLGQSPLATPQPTVIPPTAAPDPNAPPASGKPASVGSAIGVIAGTAAKVLPMLGLQGSVWGTALLWGLQALDVVGTAAGATATPTGGAITAGLAGTAASSIVSMIGRFFSKKS